MNKSRSSLHAGIARRVAVAALAAGSLALASLPASAAGPSSQPPTSVVPVQYGFQHFEYPTHRGAIIDWCASWATNCGWAGAHQFCQMRGFARAVRWRTFRPGRTYVIGSGQFCDGNDCQGFLSVDCAN